MMSMRFAISLGVLSMALFTSALLPAVRADEPPPVAVPSAIDSAAGLLALTPDQQTKADALRKKFQIDAHYVSIDKSLTRDQKSAKIVDLEKTTIANIKALLTHDQRVQIAADQAQIVKQENERNAKIAKLQAQENLDAQDYKAQRQLLLQSLSKTQIASLQAIESDTSAKIAKVRAATALTDKAQEAQVAEILAEHDKAQAAVFNPDQTAIIVRINAIVANADETKRQMNIISPAVVISPVP